MGDVVFRFDSAIAHAVMSWPQWLYPFMYSLSFIGRPVFTIGALVGVALFSILRHNLSYAIAAAVAGATFAADSLLKLAIHRPRPATYDVNDVILPSYSFPSGHAASSVVVFGLLAYMAWKLLPHPWGAVVAGIIAVIIIAIGISRIYLGAHYPSDVLGGWVVGLIGLAIIIWVVRPS